MDSHKTIITIVRQLVTKYATKAICDSKYMTATVWGVKDNAPSGICKHSVGDDGIFSMPNDDGIFSMPNDDVNIGAASVAMHVIHNIISPHITCILRDVIQGITPDDNFEFVICAAHFKAPSMKCCNCSAELHPIEDAKHDPIYLTVPCLHSICAACNKDPKTCAGCKSSVRECVNLGEALASIPDHLLEEITGKLDDILTKYEKITSTIHNPKTIMSRLGLEEIPNISQCDCHPIEMRNI